MSTATGPAGAWREVNPESGDPVFNLPAVLAGSGGRVAGPAGRGGAEAETATHVGALRRVRAGGRVLRRRAEEGVSEAAGRGGTAPRDGDRWQDREAAAR